MIASEILEYYRGGNEEQRLRASIGRLERIRTWEVIERHLPPAPSVYLMSVAEPARMLSRWPVAVTTCICSIRFRYTSTGHGRYREHRRRLW